MKFIRKIVSTLAVAGLVFVFASCGGNKADKIVSELEDATEEVNGMKSLEDFKKFEDNFKDTKKELKNMSKEGKNEFTEEEKERIDEAFHNYAKACSKKARELSGLSAED